MSRSCVVAYEWSPGVVRGTLVQNGEVTSKDGARTLLERMRSEGYQSMVRWIERGIREGGYTTLTSDTPASEAPGDHPVTETGVGYVVSWNGIQNIRNFTLD